MLENHSGGAATETYCVDCGTEAESYCPYELDTDGEGLTAHSGSDDYSCDVNESLHPDFLRIR